MDKIALFDFCGTIANFQTADSFVHYVRKNLDSSKMLKKERLRQFLRQCYLIDFVNLFFPKLSFNKRLVLWQLKGIPISELENYAYKYYYEIVKPNLITLITCELKKLKSKNWKIYIVSGGYYIYLKYFAIDFDIDLNNIIAVQINQKNGICSGRFDSGDVLWNKVQLLEKRFEKNSIDSIAFSDSITDLPMLKWAKRSVVVSKLCHQKWTDDYQFKEIIWGK